VGLGQGELRVSEVTVRSEAPPKSGPPSCAMGLLRMAGLEGLIKGNRKHSALSPDAVPPVFGGRYSYLSMVPGAHCWLLAVMCVCCAHRMVGREAFSRACLEAPGFPRPPTSSNLCTQTQVGAISNWAPQALGKVPLGNDCDPLTGCWDSKPCLPDSPEGAESQP
jgi:hypothetical protein